MKANESPKAAKNSNSGKKGFKGGLDGRGRTLNDSLRKKKHFEKELRQSKKAILVIKKESINRQRSPTQESDPLTTTF